MTGYPPPTGDGLEVGLDPRVCSHDQRSGATALVVAVFLSGASLALSVAAFLVAVR